MIIEFCKKADISEEAASYLQESFERIIKTPKLIDDLFFAMDNFYCCSDEGYIKILEEISQKSGVHRYTVDAIFIIMCTKPLRYIYRQRGFSEELYLETVKDIKYKLTECKDVYGVWGIFVIGWFRRFFMCERFKLGRLQYESIEFPFEEYKDFLKKGDKVYMCHIPSAGPMNLEMIMDSLKQAYEFYRPELKDGLMPVLCESWLLYTPHFELFPENSNLKKFSELFDIIKDVPSEKNHDFWRIFNCEYKPEILDEMPQDTTLRRNLIRFLKDGKCMGEGFGIFIFDGEKLLEL